MILYLVRHGDALPEMMDPVRSLSPQGRKEVEKVAGRIRIPCGAVQRIWHSEKKRAQETAQMIAGAVGSQNICREMHGLNPNDSPQAMFDQINDLLEKKSLTELMIVGHLPFLGILASLLLVRSPAIEIINFPSAGVLCLECRTPPMWRIRWMIFPDVA